MNTKQNKTPETYIAKYSGQGSGSTYHLYTPKRRKQSVCGRAPLKPLKKASGGWNNYPGNDHKKIQNLENLEKKVKYKPKEFENVTICKQCIASYKKQYKKQEAAEPQ